MNFVNLHKFIKNALKYPMPSTSGTHNIKWEKHYYNTYNYITYNDFTNNDNTYNT